MARFFHTADLHLDAPFSRLPAEKAARRRALLHERLAALVTSALEHGVDAVIFAGDLFDSCAPNPATVAYVMKQLSRLKAAGVRAFVVPGNHDFYTRGGLWDAPGWNGVAVIFKESSWTIARMDDLGVSIHGIACHAPSSDADVLKSLKADESQRLNLAILHGSRDREYFRGERCYPFDGASVDRLGVDFLCLGHYHQFAAVGSSGKAVYSGSPEALDFGEPGPRYAAVVELDGKGASITPLLQEGPVVETLALDCTPLADIADVLAEIERHAATDKLLKVTLRGAPPVELQLDPDGLVSAAGANFFHLEIEDRTVLGSLETGERISVRGRFLSRMAELGESAVTEEEKHKLALATRYGLAALRGKNR